MPDGTVLLQYLLSNAPQPLATGSRGRINIYVREAGKAYCDEIRLLVPVSLFQSVPTCDVNTNLWEQSAFNRVKAGEAGAAVDSFEFILHCVDPRYYEITYNFVIGIQGDTSGTPATNSMTVFEHSATTPNGPFSKRELPLPVVTQLPQFQLQNFVATMAGQPLVPRTQFNNGVDIVLSWESNGTWFELYRRGETAPFWSDKLTTATVKGGAAADTTFFLRAAMAGNPGGEHENPGFQTVYLYDALTITVAGPDLAARSVATTGNASVGAALSVAGPATISGETHLDRATVNGPLTVSHDFFVQGNAVLAGVGIRASLQVDGTATLSGLNVNSDMTATGLATFNGGMTVNAVDTARLSIGPWSFTASPEGNLVVSNGKQSLTFTAQGSLNVDNKRVIRDQDPVKIQSATKNAWLDWTQKIKGNGATKYSGVAYWTTDRGDADTQLKIYSG